MHDVLPAEPEKDRWLDSSRWQAVERIFREVCRCYGYREIRTPVMESTELFTRSIGLGTDIVSKEMFTFEDRGGRSMTLRPEGTAPVIRSYLEHNLASEGGLTKLFYIATIYRYERGQRGRYREHQQTGVEALGSGDPALDAEVLSLAIEFYRRLGITNCELRVNSVGCPACRPGYRNALLGYARPRLERMSADAKTRFEINPLRMLDSKDERDKRELQDAPKLVDYLCDNCASHFEATKSHLNNLDVSFKLDTNLVRGFDYYTKTAFEVVSPELGTQNVIGGGGRYDGLVEECGGPSTPGIGFGIGTERCLIVLDQLGIDPRGEAERAGIDIFVASADEAGRGQAVRLVHALRRQGAAAETDYQGRSLKSQMRQANRLGAHYAVVLGSEEAQSGAATVRDLRDDSGQFRVPLDALLSEAMSSIQRAAVTSE